MNRRQKQKLYNCFARRWLEEVFMRCRRMRGSLHHLRTKHWERLGQMIYEEGNERGDEFNQLFEKYGK